MEKYFTVLDAFLYKGWCCPANKSMFVKGMHMMDMMCQLCKSDVAIPGYVILALVTMKCQAIT